MIFSMSTQTFCLQSGKHERKGDSKPMDTTATQRFRCYWADWVIGMALLCGVAGCSSGDSGSSVPPPLPTGSVAFTPQVDRGAGQVDAVTCVGDGIAYLTVNTSQASPHVGCSSNRVVLSGVPVGTQQFRLEGKVTTEGPPLWASGNLTAAVSETGPPVELGTVTLKRQFQALEISNVAAPPPDSGDSFGRVGKLAKSFFGGVGGLGNAGSVDTVFAVVNTAESTTKAANRIAIAEREIVNYVLERPDDVPITSYVGADGQIIRLSNESGSAVQAIYPGNDESIVGQVPLEQAQQDRLQPLALVPLNTVARIKTSQPDFAQSDWDAINFKAVSTSGARTFLLSHNCITLGLTCTFRLGRAQNGGNEITSVQNGQNFHLRVSTTAGAEKAKQIMVTGTSDGDTVTTYVAALVFPPETTSIDAANFSLAVTPSRATITPGVTSDFVVQLSGANQVNVALRVECQAGISCTNVSPGSLTLPQDATNPPRFTVTLPNSRAGTILPNIRVIARSLAGKEVAVEVPIGVSIPVTLVSAPSGTVVPLQDFACGAQQLIDGSCGSFAQEVSGSGRYIPFTSRARELFGNTGERQQLFLRDLQTDTTLVVSHQAGNALAVGNGSHNGASSVSADGRYVAFTSNATNLVAGTPNMASLYEGNCGAAGQPVVRIYVWDRVTTAITPLTPSANAHSCEKTATSPDGRFVLFNSLATNLGAAVQAGVQNLYLWDRLNPLNLQLISRGITGAANGNSENPDITADGRYVVFDSCASNLPVQGGYAQNGPADGRCPRGLAASQVFIYDRVNDVFNILSRRQAGEDGSGYSGRPRITPNGRLVVFESSAPNLDSERADSNNGLDVFLWERKTGEVRRVSVRSDGQEFQGDTTNIEISDDGQFIIFDSTAGLAPSDTNGVDDIYIKNLWLNTLSLVSISRGGSAANGISRFPQFSSEGGIIAFTSLAGNLVSGDNNSRQDAFVVQRK